MKFIALLRGINVGGKNKVAMPALKAVSYTHLDVYKRQALLTWRALLSGVSTLSSGRPKVIWPVGSARNMKMPITGTVVINGCRTTRCATCRQSGVSTASTRRAQGMRTASIRRPSSFRIAGKMISLSLIHI